MKYSFEVENMKCNGCVNSIIDGLTAIDGINDLSVVLETSTVSFVSEPEKLKEIEATLEKLGYPKKQTNDLLDKARQFLKNN